MPDHYFIRFTLNLGYEQYLSVYQGAAKNVSVIAEDGRRIQFPAGNIQSFLTRQGIQGVFEMELSAQNKFIGIRKIR
ncbi:MAG: DUF2835 domain-containing protein [Gammaproteobacteria bacterium HGW-Gammaproteobacteria-3]|nr:MAG: DUF2835 domain-containing protein [Gammaproteobacteria bacterium HGW-Gammaproteobacteria-3]